MHTTYHGSISSGNVYQLTAQFRNLMGDQVARFEYQVRPFEWVEFRNISLRPRVKMEPRVQAGAGESMDWASVTVQPGVGFDDIIVGERGGTIEHVQSILGPPDRQADRWLDYRDKYGLDLSFDPSGRLAEIRMNPGFQGCLSSGISMESSKADVFQRYGRPVDERQTDVLSRKNDERILYTRGKISQICYGDHGLLFRFRDNRVNQMVTFPKLPRMRGQGAEDSPADGAQSISRETKSDLLPNIFVMGSSRGAGDIFDATIARAGEWTWNKTGRGHTKEAYDEIFNGTHNRTDHDLLVLIFSLDQEDRIPSEYEDLLPKPWAQIQQELEQGRTVELSGRARGLHVVVLAAPRAEQLKEAIASSRFLGNPRALLGSSSQGSDVVVEDFKVRTDPDRATFSVVASIRNAGRAASPQFVVGFYQGDPKTARVMVHGAGPIEPGGTWNEQSRDFGLTDGVKEIHVVLDPANLVEEPDETNNHAALRIAVKDGQIAEQSLIPAP